MAQSCKEVNSSADFSRPDKGLTCLKACILLCTHIHTLDPFLFPSLSLVEGTGELQSKYYYKIQECKRSCSSLGIFGLFLSVEQAGCTCGIIKVS